MKIDEKKVYGLTNFSNKKKGIHAKQSDHNPNYIDLTLNYEKEKDDRKTVYKFKNKESLKMFKHITSITNSFTDCFEEGRDLLKAAKRWEKLLMKHIF